MLRALRLLVLSLTACHSACAADPPRVMGPPQDPEAATKVMKRNLTVDDLPKLVWRPGAMATFAPTTAEERAVVEKLVPALLAGAAATPPPDPLRWQADAVRVGLRIEIWQVDGGTYWVLTEAPERRRGAGAYLFRVGATVDDHGPAVLLEAPHSDYDLGTGEIAGELFFHPPPGKRPVALFMNTMHRYQLAPGRKQKRADNPADVAHNPDHLYNAATVAAAAALGDVLVEQIHGFADSADEADDAPLPAGTLMVVSAGDKRGSSPLSGAIAAKLRSLFGEGVRRFPEESKALGATTNAQKRALEGRAGARFVHIESSAEMRKELRATPAKLQSFGAVLFNTTER
jgi:hypothetical protein